MPPILPLEELAKPAFLTGSYCYGTPTEKSDIDLVVYMPDADQAALLAQQADSSGTDATEYQGVRSYCLKFGKLNLLVCTTKETYNEWVQGTKELEQQKPVTRDKAVETFKRIRGD